MVEGESRWKRARSRTIERIWPMSHTPLEKIRECTSSPELPNLKVRIMTWNMHGTVPRGDLQVLFGKMEPYRPPTPGWDDLETDATDSVRSSKCSQENIPRFDRIPQLDMKSTHPYHVVVVSCQECPWGDGSNFQHGLHTAGEIGSIALGRNRSPRNMTPEDIQRMEEVLSASSSSPVDVAQDSMSKASADATSAGTPDQLHIDTSVKASSESPPCESPDALSAHLATVESNAWSKICYDWFCKGVMSPFSKTIPPSYVCSYNTGSPGEKSFPTTSNSMPSNPEAQLSPQDMRTPPAQIGMYQLVIKERMMGCYSAVYVWRGCIDRVHGASSNVVKSGLLAGRMGNKGGIGVSLHIGRTRLLFVNAHLAAHVRKMDARIANIKRIQQELRVDTFLPPDDPRNGLSDVTEKFDYCFWCGDLNFRVDITRAQADALITEKSYDCALESDQLRKVLSQGWAFQGFHEAPIDFPPTYKYDVEKVQRQKSRQHRAAVPNVPSHLPEEKPATRPHSWRWFRHRIDKSDDAMAEEASQTQETHMATLTRTNSVTSTSSNMSESSSLLEEADRSESSISNMAQAMSLNDTVGDNQMVRDKLTHKVSSTSLKSRHSYDSSAKQRVPSWCDRVLWRSNMASEDQVTHETKKRGGFWHRHGTKHLTHASSEEKEHSHALSVLANAPLTWIYAVAELGKDSLVDAFCEEHGLSPARGQVRVLEYRTIEDDEVQALGGSSDHRPVIFAAVLGI